jgi:hypothetical protein
MDSYTTRSVPNHPSKDEQPENVMRVVGETPQKTADPVANTTADNVTDTTTTSASELFAIPPRNQIFNFPKLPIELRFKIIHLTFEPQFYMVLPTSVPSKWRSCFPVLYMNLLTDTLTVRTHHLTLPSSWRNLHQFRTTDNFLEYIDIDDSQFTLSFGNMITPHRYHATSQRDPLRESKTLHWSQYLRDASAQDNSNDYADILLELVAYSVTLRGAQIVLPCAASMVENLDCMQHSKMAEEIDMSFKALLLTHECFGRCWEMIQLEPCKGGFAFRAKMKASVFTPTEETSQDLNIGERQRILGLGRWRELWANRPW